MYGTRVPATLHETDAVHDWARQHGASIKRHDGRDPVWDLRPARKAAHAAAEARLIPENKP